MFSFLMTVLTFLQAGKKKIVEKKEKYNLKREEILQKMNEAMDKTDGNTSKEDDSILSKIKKKGKTKKDTKDESLKTKLMTIFTTVVVFFETLPVFFSVIVWFAVLIIVGAVVVIIFAYLAMLQAAITQAEEDALKFNKDETTGMACSRADIGGILEWTDAELASRGIKLTDHEKNMYRLGIFARKAIEGYGGAERMQSQADLSTRIIFEVGVASIETGMTFYNSGTEQDITKVPSDEPLNSKGFGFMGIHGSDTLEDYFGAGAISNIKKIYSPSTPPSYDSQYAPWGVAMSVGHMEGKLKKYVTGRNRAEDLKRIANEWGIKANVDEFVGMSELMLMQAQYHGAYVSDHNDYANFWAALFVATSDNDAERTFAKWSRAGTTYDESSIRYSFLGGTGWTNITGTSYALSLNNQTIKENIWTYLEREVSALNPSGFNQAKSDMSSKAKSQNVQVLNYHYGFNSYLTGKKVESDLAKKMNVVGTSKTQEDCGSSTVTPGNFKATPGKGQAVSNGKTTEELLSEYLKKYPNMTSYMSTLKEQWGTSTYLTDKNNKAVKNGYVDKYFGVPFYGQGASYKEGYGSLYWYPGADPYNESGCMVYSHAYAASALTGKLINPAEMGALLIMRNYLGGGGLSRTGVENIYKAMGLNAETYTDTLSSWGKIDEALKKGGVVVVRGHVGFFTDDDNHFIVLNKLEEKNGKKFYSFYSSYQEVESMTLMSEEQLKKELWLQAVAVWK